MGVGLRVAKVYKSNDGARVNAKGFDTARRRVLQCNAAVLDDGPSPTAQRPSGAASASDEKWRAAQHAARLSRRWHGSLSAPVPSPNQLFPP